MIDTRAGKTASRRGTVSDWGELKKSRSVGLTDKAWKNWQLLAERRNLSVSELIERLGRVLDDSWLEVIFGCEKDKLHPEDIDSSLSLTFGEAISEFEIAYWQKKDCYGFARKPDNKRQRTKWNTTYGKYFRDFPPQEKINKERFLLIVDKYSGAGRCVFALRKLAKFIGIKDEIC